MPDNDRLTWLRTEEGRDWLRTVSLLELVSRQGELLDVYTPEADQEYDIIEGAIRGENDEVDLRTGPTLSNSAT
jgi:hypothetical protein